jgi:hypothetical protein
MMDLAMVSPAQWDRELSRKWRHLLEHWDMRTCVNLWKL